MLLLGASITVSSSMVFESRLCIIVTIIFINMFNINININNNNIINNYNNLKQ